MGEIKKKGYYLVCPDFGPGRTKLSDDDQVRCLCYLLGHITEIVSVPKGVHFEIIPLRWHHFGEAYPSIGMTADSETEISQAMTNLSFTLGDQLTEFITALNLDKLVELSASETLCWADIVTKHGN